MNKQFYLACLFLLAFFSLSANIDLELSLTQRTANPQQWGFYTVTATVSNTGSQAANNVAVEWLSPDGQFEYSEVITVALSKKQELFLFPNPTVDVLTVNQLKEGEMIKIYNHLGKEISVENLINTVSENIIEVEVSTLQSGIYFLITEDSTLKFTKI